MDIKDNDELRNFVKRIRLELQKNNEINLANDLKNWNNESFTSSSEFLGELMLLLEKVKLSMQISDVKKKEIIECILIIRKALTV
ncbi:hypothetical protein [Aminipila terrae]|uniref:Uncharacterized protein n=1 Tax=Aminipila terrae TaxID=2697030 RepID=A0A6P1MR61_9FIRM|nr:hypothetical protein [Aminipila terrae]QHI73485.1 hypothetical protein Ami3637_14850 [Aminipila terrae]